ncbi:MAG: DNA primase [Planktomarina sp.]
MALPPGFLDDLRSRTSIAHVVGRKVIWDTRKSNQAKGDMWAPCPFHQEKTASFHVDDRKGYYYCFGCHAKGDALGFVKETENVSFMEAVEILAREAGMQMPAQDPRAQEKTDHRTRLAAVMDEAVKFFRLQLQTRMGEAARDYLQGRGLDQAALDRWEIGFAPDAWQGLWDHLTSKDISEDLILAAGLAKPSNLGKRPYDTFRNRIMFPIRDPRGRAVAFGGRAMDPGESAKYLNSPQTDLFDKSRVLYNHGPARAAAGKGQALIVSEGYMDVIALAQAGFEAAVAPLGTAVTEHHLQHLWRIADEPIIALDGDTAGLRAAQRVIDLALPLITAGKSLRFAIMPEGQDPDDVIRAGGPSAMQTVLDTAQPIVQLLWQRETAGKTFDSPERRAALDKALRGHLTRIEDRNLRSHYGQAIKDLRFELFRGGASPARSNIKPRHALATPATKASSVTQGAAGELREAVVLATILQTPQVLGGIAPHLEDIQFSNPRYDQMRGFFASYIGTSDALWDACTAGFGDAFLNDLMSAPHVKIAPSVRRKGDIDFVTACLQMELKQIIAPQAHALEMEDGERDITDNADERLTWRIAQSAQSLAEARRGPAEDAEEYDTADNGAKVKREERSAFDNLLDQITFKKR